MDHYETVLKKNVDDHHQLVEALQLDAHQKLVAEYEKYHELSTLNNTLCEEYERKLDKLREEHDAAMNTLISEYEAKLQSSVRQLEMVKECITIFLYNNQMTINNKHT